MTNEIHKPVLLNEVLDVLSLQKGQIIVDGTANGGGHLEQLAKSIGSDGRVIAVEIDPEISHILVQHVNKNELDADILVVNDSYENIKAICDNLEIKCVDAVLLDLGMSSWHLEKSGRGFSFSVDEPLDMRYDPTQGMTAAEIVNQYSLNKLIQVIKMYSEEKFAIPIAKTIVKKRKEKRIITTQDLVETIGNAVPDWYKVLHRKRHFATKVFQALRIEVNQELKVLDNSLDEAYRMLCPKGRLVVISFHSLEDRIVKDKFRKFVKDNNAQLITKKAITASQQEVMLNRRARSAKLRALIKK